MTPCEKCKAERKRLAEQVALLERERDEARRGWQDLAALSESDAAERGTLKARVAELEAHVAKRHACVNCGPCPCSETD